MTSYDLKITSFFKNSRLRKIYKATLFYAFYRESKDYKFIIDTEEDKRIVLILNVDEIKKLNQSLTNSLQQINRS